MSDRRRAARGGKGLVAKVLPDATVEPALRTAYRRGGRVLAWLVVVASPLVMLVGLVVLRPSSSPTPQTSVSLQGDTPAGWSEMYVRAWLSASRDDSAGLETFYPAGMKSQRAVGTQVPADTATVSVMSPTPGSWSVVVAVDLLTQQPDGKHKARFACFRVSVVEGVPMSYAAAALPSPVACPSTLGSVSVDYPHTAELEGAIGQSVLGFLAAYTTGRGQLDRYTTPGTPLVPIQPALYTAVQLVELRTHESFEPGQEARPLDRTQAHVLTRAWGYDATGETTVMDYALTLTARSGRWEVNQIDSAPLRTGG